jgi:hypothetical protein
VRVRPLGAGDCEYLHDGVLVQPVNAVSSLAYVAAGAALVARSGRRGEGPRARGWLAAYGLAVAANGFGGVAYHGLGGRGGRWLHDAALLATLSVAVAAEVSEATGRELGGPQAAAASAAGAVLALSPGVSQAAQAGLGVGAVAADAVAGLAAHDHRARRRAPLVALWAVAAGLHIASRTGGPLCRPGSRLQGHAAWHGLSALALWWWGRQAADVAASRI